MGYIETVLQPDETVQFRTNFHWVGLIPGLVLLLLAALIYAVTDRTNGWYAVWIGLAVLLCAGGVILLVKAWFDRWITEIAVTNRRVIYKTGFISRDTDEMPLGKIENIEVSQSILGRLFNYGNVDVRGTGSGGIGPEKLHRISAPLEFRNHVMAG